MIEHIITLSPVRTYSFYIFLFPVHFFYLFSCFIFLHHRFFSKCFELRLAADASAFVGGKTELAGSFLDPAHRRLAPMALTQSARRAFAGYSDRPKHLCLRSRNIQMNIYDYALLLELERCLFCLSLCCIKLKSRKIYYKSAPRIYFHLITI